MHDIILIARLHCGRQNSACEIENAPDETVRPRFERLETLESEERFEFEQSAYERYPTMPLLSV